MPKHAFRLRGQSVAAAAAIALTMALSGCADSDFDLKEWDAPGQNARVGSMLIRYAHLAEPRGEPWKPGDDVPAYVWLFNEASETDTLLGASTPAAASVVIEEPGGETVPGGVPLPPNELVEMEPTNTHLVLRDLDQQVRGGDFVEVTFRFENAGSITLPVASQPPVVDKSPSPTW